MNYYLILDGSGNPSCGGVSNTTIPEGAVVCSQVQAKQYLECVVVNGVVTGPTPQLAVAQSSVIQTLTAACGAAIVGGYVSSALGSAHTYGSALSDQINMLGSVTASLLPGLASNWTTSFWCADSTGTWSMVPHTALQIQQVGLDGKAWVTTCQIRLETLSAQVAAAASLSSVEAVVW